MGCRFFFSGGFQAPLGEHIEVTLIEQRGESGTHSAGSAYLSVIQMGRHINTGATRIFYANTAVFQSGIYFKATMSVHTH